MDKDHFEQYDRERLEEARQLLLKVYEYYYGDSKTKSKTKRLWTIIRKLDSLLKIDGEKANG